jgi:hypothetical protein
MLPISSSLSHFSLNAEGEFISKDELISLYESFVFYSYQGKLGFAYCSELNLSEDPSVTLYSVQLERKFRSLKIKDFNFIKSKSLDDLIQFFNLNFDSTKTLLHEEVLK